MEDDFKWKTTSNIKIEISRQLLVLQWKVSNLPQILNLGFHMKMTFNGRRHQMEDDIKWKTTSNGRWHQMEDNIKWKTTSNGRLPQISSEISKQQLVRSYSKFKLMLIGPKQTLQIFQMKTTYNRRRHQKEDYFKYQKWNISATTGRMFSKF